MNPTSPGPVAERIRSAEGRSAPADHSSVRLSGGPEAAASAVEPDQLAYFGSAFDDQRVGETHEVSWAQG